MHSSAVWREAAMLRDCGHARIVPLFGVALKVGCRWPAVPLCSDRLSALAPTPHLSLPPCLAQGQIVLLAMDLMKGGTLRAALQDAHKRAALHWLARCGPSGRCCCRRNVADARTLAGWIFWLGGGRCKERIDMPAGQRSACLVILWVLIGALADVRACRGRQVAADVAGALDYLHRRNVMHGDLSSRWGCAGHASEASGRLHDTLAC